MCLCVCVRLLSSQEVRADDSASEELLTYHEAVLNLREAEDALVEHHKEIVEEQSASSTGRGDREQCDGVCAAG